MRRGWSSKAVTQIREHHKTGRRPRTEDVLFHTRSPGECATCECQKDRIRPLTISQNRSLLGVPSTAQRLASDAQRASQENTQLEVPCSMPQGTPGFKPTFIFYFSMRPRMHCGKQAPGARWKNPGNAGIGINRLTPALSGRALLVSHGHVWIPRPHRNKRNGFCGDGESADGASINAGCG